MPHHPGTGGVIEESVAASKVTMDVVFLLVLNESADGSMDDTFGL